MRPIAFDKLVGCTAGEADSVDERRHLLETEKPNSMGSCTYLAGAPRAADGILDTAFAVHSASYHRGDATAYMLLRQLQAWGAGVA